jgi:hypothetical protein
MALLVWQSKSRRGKRRQSSLDGRAVKNCYGAGSNSYFAAYSQLAECIETKIVIY